MMKFLNSLLDLVTSSLILALLKVVMLLARVYNRNLEPSKAALNKRAAHTIEEMLP